MNNSKSKFSYDTIKITYKYDKNKAIAHINNAPDSDIIEVYEFKDDNTVIAEYNFNENIKLKNEIDFDIHQLPVKITEYVNGKKKRVTKVNYSYY